MILSIVRDVASLSERDSGIDHLVTVGHEFIPLMILGHSQRTFSQLLVSFIGIVSLAFHDVGKNLVGLLYFADYDGLELSTRGFQVEISLCMLADTSAGVRAY